VSQIFGPESLFYAVRKENRSGLDAKTQLRTTEMTRLRALPPRYSKLLAQVDSSFAIAVRPR